jgi:hypothetical protein
MSFITIVPVAPLRAEPSHRSEMVSQLLFGEYCELLEYAKDFLKVRCEYDGYEGWVQRMQLVEINISEETLKAGFVSAYTSEVLVNNESYIIPHAAPIPISTVSPEINLGGYRIMNLEPTTSFNSSDAEVNLPRLINEYAHRYMGTSYLWGGKSVFGVDCSGFVQQVFKMVGIKLPRDAYQQAVEGELVGFLQEARLGDLAYFDNEEGRITHVGIMLNDHQIIHSSGYVHIDPIDSQGILHHITKERTHNLRIIKRMFS